MTTKQKTTRRKYGKLIAFLAGFDAAARIQRGEAVPKDHPARRR
ncbi:hypothetical protein [Nocardioides sp.]|nr:hypothetical protein [Nocardioides sp.]